VVGVIDNLLNQVNLAGFEDLQAEEPAGQSVLKNTERYALYLATAMSQNASEREILLSRGNIGEAIYSLHLLNLYGLTREAASNAQFQTFLPALLVVRSEG